MNKPTWAEKERILERARKFNGQIKTFEDLFEHMDRLQKCSYCKRSYWDKLCPTCYVSKVALKFNIDEIERSNWDCSNGECGLVNNNADVCKSCGSKKEDSCDNDSLEELKKELFEEDFEEINYKAITNGCQNGMAGNQLENKMEKQNTDDETEKKGCEFCGIKENCNICEHLESCTIELSLQDKNPEKFVCGNFKLRQEETII